MQRIAFGALEMAAAQSAVILQVADRRLDRLSPLYPCPLPPRQRLRLATVQDRDAVDLASAIAQVHDRRRRPLSADDLRLFELLGQSVAVVRITRETPCAHHQALPGRDRNAHLHPELVW